MDKIEQRISSREVAKMMEVEHKHLLEKIDGIRADLLAENSADEKYWIESSYEYNGRKLREYQVSKRGCEFLAHKTTGTKGNLFTDRYMDKFEEMKETIENENSAPKTALERLMLCPQAILEVNEKVDSVRKDLEDLKNDMPVLAVDLDRIKYARNQKIVPLLGGKKSNAYNGNSLRTKVYKDNGRQLCREFGIEKFNQLKRSQVDDAITIIKQYELPRALREEIENVNAQMSFK